MSLLSKDCPECPPVIPFVPREIKPLCEPCPVEAKPNFLPKVYYVETTKDCYPSTIEAIFNEMLCGPIRGCK